MEKRTGFPELYLASFVKALYFIILTSLRPVLNFVLLHVKVRGDFHAIIEPQLTNTLMSNWNNNFTTLLRKDRPVLWGNWALNQYIKPGAVGIIDSSTGNFTLVNECIPGAEVIESNISSDWYIKSSNVTEKQSNVTLDGSATDPETGEKITAGLQVTWGFKDAGSLCSKFSTSKESSLKDFSTLINNQMSWLEKQAASVNMKTSQGISQGFCVVTDVIYANSGLNVGANNKSSNFSIEGSVSGINAMLGNSASGSGSYVSSSETNSMDQHIWPSTANTLPTNDVPIAFAVASFYGTFIIPNWTHLLSSFELILDNTHGGTYIAHGTLTYDVNGTQHSKKNSASGGMKSTIGDIPIDALNLVYHVSFSASKTKKTFSWGSPVNQWLSGVRHIDVKGVWPGTPSATDREAT